MLNTMLNFAQAVHHTHAIIRINTYRSPPGEEEGDRGEMVGELGALAARLFSSLESLDLLLNLLRGLPFISISLSTTRTINYLLDIENAVYMA